VKTKVIDKENVKRVRELFSEFQKGNHSKEHRTGKLCFQNVDGQDVYNPTAPFTSAGKLVIAGRVEPRDQEHSNVLFFQQAGDAWFPIADAPRYILQDPFVTFVQDELVFGGVRIREVGNKLDWATVFYRGKDIFSLEEFFCGPPGMKDIRLCDLENGRIAVFTRPQGEIGGRGTIAYLEISQLDELTIDAIPEAELLQPMIHPLDWTGVNEAHLLSNGEIGLLSHVSCFEDDDRKRELHYYAASFIFDPVSRRFRNLKIIASRDQFDRGPAKREELVDVVFPSGLIRAGGTTTLYAGVSDAEVHWIEIEYPF
jgi:hypothetical protein